MTAQIIYPDFGQRNPLIPFYADIYTTDRLKITLELKAMTSDHAVLMAINTANAAGIHQIQCLVLYQGTPTSHHRNKEPLVVLHANVRNELIKC